MNTCVDFDQRFEAPTHQSANGQEHQTDASGIQKPPYSYVALISMAISSSPTGRLTLSQIYNFIDKEFAYYRNADPKRRMGWQNSIRHNLSLNSCFVKISRDGLVSTQERKGNYWCMAAKFVDMFENGNFKRRRQVKRQKKPEHASRSDGIDLFHPPWSYSAYNNAPSSLNALELPANQSTTFNNMNLAYYWGIHPQATSEPNPATQANTQFNGLFHQFSTQGSQHSVPTTVSQSTTDPHLVSWPFVPPTNTSYQVNEANAWSSIQIPQVSYNTPKVDDNSLTNQF